MLVEGENVAIDGATVGRRLIPLGSRAQAPGRFWSASSFWFWMFNVFFCFYIVPIQPWFST